MHTEEHNTSAAELKRGLDWLHAERALAGLTALRPTRCTPPTSTTS
jgi:hypothetical protein